MYLPDWLLQTWVARKRHDQVSTFWRKIHGLTGEFHAKFHAKNRCRKVETKRNKFAAGSRQCTCKAWNSTLDTLPSLANHNASCFLLTRFYVLRVTRKYVKLHNNRGINHVAYRTVPPIDKQDKYNDDDHQQSKYCKQNSNPTAAFTRPRGRDSSRGTWTRPCALERSHTIRYEVRFSLAVA